MIRIHLKTEEIDVNRYVKSLLKIAATIIRITYHYGVQRKSVGENNMY